MEVWKYNGVELKELPEGVVGFIYKIHNLTNGRTYIGKKSCFSVTNPQISKKKYDELKAQGVAVTKTKNKALSKKDNVVWRYKQKNVVKADSWQSYTGSSDELNKDIKSGHKYEKHILKFCYSKTELTLKEVETQFIEGVLYDCNSYNTNILGKFFQQVKC